jgi:SAM-dependent methyltransferase
VSHWKQRFIHLIRSVGLLPGLESLYVSLGSRKYVGDDERFHREYPELQIPPKSIIRETYGPVSVQAYHAGGLLNAELIAGLITNHRPNPVRVLEWGCGPGRILCHLVKLLPQTQFYGSDYNKEAISWCKSSIREATFSENGLLPPLGYPNQHFDAVYAVSVLTHLSVLQQQAWMRELQRLLTPNGLLILTTHGDESTKVLLPFEKEKFEKDGIVIRSTLKEGSRIFVTYHHPKHTRARLFSAFTVVEHIPGASSAAVASSEGRLLGQDIWILRLPVGTT